MVDKSIVDKIKKTLDSSIYSHSDDVINIACDKCGKCCKGMDLRLSAYELYKLSKYFKDSDEFVKKAINLDLDDKIGLVPIMNRKLNKYCYCSSFDNNGDIKCAINEEDKPITCKMPFLALAYDMTGMFNFVPYDEEIEFVDIDKIVNSEGEKEKFIYVRDKMVNCNCTSNKEVTIKEYIKNFDKDFKYLYACTLLENLVSKYIKYDILQKLDMLTTYSSINFLNNNKKTMFPLGELLSKLTFVTYLSSCYNDKINSDEDFYNHILKSSEYLQKNLLLKLRILSKDLINIFSSGDKDRFMNIISANYSRKSQKEFDDYFKEYRDCIMKEFILVILSMANHLNDLNIKKEDES